MPAIQPPDIPLAIKPREPFPESLHKPRCDIITLHPSDQPDLPTIATLFNLAFIRDPTYQLRIMLENYFKVTFPFIAAGVGMVCNVV